MATCTISDSTWNSLLDALLNNTSFAVATPYVSLHTADPGTTGASEVTAGGYTYARQAISASAAGSGAITSDGTLTWTNLPSATVTHVGLWSAATTGTFYLGCQLVAQQVVNAGGTFTINTGDFDLSKP